MVIRPATAPELAHLPDVLSRWQLLPGDECYVAEASSPRRLVGAAVFGSRTFEGVEQAAQVDLTLMPRFLNAGTIHDLLRPLISRARELGFERLHLIGARRSPSREAAALEEVGFTERHSQIFYEFSLAKLHERVERISRRLARRGGRSEGIEVIDFTTTHWLEAVALLKSESLLSQRDQIQAEQKGLLKLYRTCSSFLLVEGKVKGVLLVRAEGGTAAVTSRVVAAELRRGGAWANALLIHHATSRSLEAGMDRVVMSAIPERHPETILLAKSLEALEIRREIFLAMDFVKR